MTAIVIKIVDGNRPELAAEARGELEGAGFVIEYDDVAGIIGVDAAKHGSGEKTYDSGFVIIGKK